MLNANFKPNLNPDLNPNLIRLESDATVEKDESHPGKVVQRHWYERNKHIFPASRWEVYDPATVRDSYSIHGSEVNKKEK
jgi:protein FAM50